MFYAVLYSKTIWFRIGTSDGILWRRQWTFRFHKMQWTLVRFSRGNLLLGFSYGTKPTNNEWGRFGKEKVYLWWRFQQWT